MECPYCGSDLVGTDWYYIGNYSAGDYQKQGDIFSCPNSESFENLEEAELYVKLNDLTIGEGKDFETLEEVCCESGNWNGHFYTDKHDDLLEGYPC